MSDPQIDRTALGEYDRDAWARNDPHAHPAASERQTYGEHTLDEYSAQWQRDQEDRKQHKGGWALQWQG
jgi:hypothetical protein